MLAQKITLLALLSQMVFFIVYFFYTQKIYNNSLKTLLVFSVTFSTALTLFCLDQNKEDLFKIIPCSCICLVYYLLLTLLKANYKTLNNFFIQKGWVKEKYNGKDFTFVILAHDEIPDYWDEKKAVPPSSLDKFITFFLFIIPILLVWLVATILIALF